MWHITSTPIAGQPGRTFSLYENDLPLSFDAYLSRLARSAAFARWYSGLLAGMPCEAFFWEHPPLSAARLSAPAEFAVIDAPGLARCHADPGPFEAPLARAAGDDVVDFPNLGGDAHLVVPRPDGGTASCAHLAAFLRLAPEARCCCLWQRVATVVRERLGEAPRWLSTSGLGVAWPHVRLDERPKYYCHAPYRRWPAPAAPLADP